VRSLRFVRYLADDEDGSIDQDVAKSEAAPGYRNFALANFMRSFGNLDHPVEHVLGVYFHQCALAMTCEQLAKAGLFLAARGSNPLTGHSVVSQRARRINALMLTCGHYDGSGDFAYRVGLPGKSGVGGGILCVAPGKASIAVWSPGLNKRQFAARFAGAGNAGQRARDGRFSAIDAYVLGTESHFCLLL
jgi:glutaminase